MDIREEIPIKSFSISAYICKVEDDVCKHLVIRRSAGYLNNTWQMISGKLEQGEQGWEGALREIKEETGLVPDRFYSANVVECFYEVGQNCINLVPVFVGFVDTAQEVKLSFEHHDYRWITIDEVDEYLTFDQQKRVLKQIEEQFVAREPNDFLRIDIARK